MKLQQQYFLIIHYSNLHGIDKHGMAFSWTARMINPLSKCFLLRPKNIKINKELIILLCGLIDNFHPFGNSKFSQITWRNQSLWSSICLLLLTIDFRTAPTSTWTSFIGSNRKIVLSTSSVSMALALKILSRSQTRIQPSQPEIWS